MLETETPSRKRQRRAADVTGLRLGRAILGYLVAITAIITLAPFRFAGAPVHGLTDIWTWTDVVMNVLMFVPIGFVYQLTRPTGSAVLWTRVLALGLVLSGSIEVVQLFAATRFSSLIDLATNTVGALLGAWSYALVIKRIEGPSTVRTLALELPLMGLVYLLIPLMWLVGLASNGGGRSWLVLPIGAFAGGILGTVYAAYLEPQRHVPRWWLLLASVGWCMVSLLPGAIRDRDLILACMAMVISSAWLRSLATGRYRDEAGPRRFEIPTLRLMMPLYAAYLGFSSLWPLDAADLTWSGTFALIPAAEAGMTEIFVALEHVAAFTLVGYLIAEFHGRDLAHYRQIARRVLFCSTLLTVLLEGARGFHPAYHASVLMVAFTIGAAVLGGWLYQLQRDHVRALLTRRTAYAPSTVRNALVASDGASIRDAAASPPTSNDPGELVLSAP